VFGSYYNCADHVAAAGDAIQIGATYLLQSRRAALSQAAVQGIFELCCRMIQEWAPN